ncbi:hypothetical protein RFI_12034 [Reticulomyxa filosa]|uniref:Uncharacterized protein n=1 Tax=Reticulomyxa filosa TaxID=46433 RepID=X6NGS4_RETFI|nr:hypothetical protein RFI_12034 [Reticulomyxa filosa]|eukprot:ETO25108.1 hypothetical protein RFI_12034 [Reticulomyxa filosa]
MQIRVQQPPFAFGRHAPSPKDNRSHASQSEKETTDTEDQTTKEKPEDEHHPSGHHRSNSSSESVYSNSQQHDQCAYPNSKYGHRRNTSFSYRNSDGQLVTVQVQRQLSRSKKDTMLTNNQVELVQAMTRSNDEETKLAHISFLFPPFFFFFQKKKKQGTTIRHNNNNKKNRHTLLNFVVIVMTVSFTSAVIVRFMAVKRISFDRTQHRFEVWIQTLFLFLHNVVNVICIYFNLDFTKKHYLRCCNPCDYMCEYCGITISEHFIRYRLQKTASITGGQATEPRLSTIREE